MTDRDTPVRQAVTVPRQRVSDLTADDRTRLAALADLMIPAADGMPSASVAGVAGTGVDHLLRVRPDLAEPLRTALALDAEPQAALDALRTGQPAVFAALGELVAGAYYLDAAVADAIGYHGRAALPVGADEPDDAALRQPVVERGARYRPDPRDPV